MTVADGQATTTGEVDVTVFPAGTARPPVTVSDMVSTSVDTPVTIHPLDNDSDPNGLPISLTSVTEAANCVVTPDMLANTIAATCSAAGTYYLVYTISNGQSQNVYGLIRLNVDPAPAGDEPPVAVPDTVLLHMGQTATVPVLNNDVNPMGWPLVVTSVSVPANAPVQATVINHGAVLVTPLQTFANAVTLTYQISNGIGYSDSTITVIPVPVPGQVSPPVTRDSTLKVRVGDVATANVLVNDSQPDGIPLELVPTLVQTPDASTGILVFTSGNAIRVQAGQTPGTYTVLYQVQVAQGSAEPATGRLTVTVTPSDPSHNQAPQPGDIEARTLAGQPITIPISLTGIDPDGDSCTLVGVASAPSQGAITAVTGNSITYDPTMSVTGSASFTYTVQDRLGAQAIGKVTVGIAPAQSSNDPPVAVTDVVQARPGRPMSVAVTANDYSPAGNSFSLVSGSAKSDSFAATTVNQNVTFTAPTTEGTYLATYEIQDSLQQSATGIISVQVSATAPLLPPNPQDDYVPMATGLSNTSVTVNVLANDSDPSGDVTQDTLTLLDSTNATVVGSNVQVTLVSQPQVIAYTLTNTQNNLTGRAYIWVPGLDTTPPQLKTGAPLVQVKAGQSVNLQLSDYVQVRSGRSPRLTSASKVTAWNGTGSAPSTTQLAFSAPLDYQGPASISFEVTDGATLNDDTGLTATLTVPITVLPPDPTQQPPTFSNSTVSVEPGASATVNLANFAKSPLGAKLTYSVTGGPALAGVKASLSGATLTVTADATTAVGGTDTISVSTSDGKNPAVSAQVDVTVVASTKPLPQALTDAANAQPGQTICVAATRNDLNPFGASAPLTIISVSVASGASSGVASVGCGGDAIGSVSITPNLSFIGQMTVSYTIQDATKQAARQASGVILVTVKGPPSAPTGIHVDSVGDKQVVLSWQPPTNDGGSPVTDYVVTGTPAYTLDCGTATICTLTGLTNTVTYTFTVTAKNAIGASPESVASAPATPDAVPDVMSPPIAQFGNSQLTFTWTPANTTGRSPVQHYELQISPIPANGQSQISTTGAGTSYTWTGLTNGTAYQVKACAVNAAPQACTEASMWSTASSPETPSAPPDPPAAPSLTVGTNLGTEAQVQICWNAPANNGAAITSYTVTASTGATATATPSGNAQTCTTMPMSNSTSAYTFTVKATNRAGTSSASGSTAVRVVGKPGVPTGLVLTDGDGSCGVNFTAPSLNGASASEVTYRWSASNGASGSFGGSTGGTATGLPNGSSNGRTGAYTISVWATTAFPGGSQTGDAATDTCQPYGPPKTPNGLTVTASGTTIKWNVPDPGGNGRPYSVQTNVNGAGWTGSSTSASGSPDVGYSKTLTVQARTCDDLTCSTEVSKSATTGAAPPPPAYCNYTINSTNVTVNFGSIAPNTTLYYNVGSGDKCVYDTAGGPTACVTNWNVYGNSYTNVGSWANGKPPSNVTFSFKGGTNLKCTKN
ncbi:MAG: Ig-like domain-containing protein [Propionibacteriaceae bacterium]|nr:Ig-like domain-containing protein [Propionibacteriaceae bacterium]